MASTKAEKCAHPVCSCMITTGEYCSVECETMEKMPDIACHCGHAGCKGETDTIASSSSATAS
jgi:metallothionein